MLAIELKQIFSRLILQMLFYVLLLYKFYKYISIIILILISMYVYFFKMKNCSIQYCVQTTVVKSSEELLEKEIFTDILITNAKVDRNLNVVFVDNILTKNQILRSTTIMFTNYLLKNKIQYLIVLYSCLLLCQNEKMINNQKRFIFFKKLLMTDNFKFIIKYIQHLYIATCKKSRAKKCHYFFNKCFKHLF